VSQTLRERIATGCRILAGQGLVSGVLGHISARAPDGSVLIRCRGPRERGVGRTTPADIRAIDLDGRPLENLEGWEPPKELWIHTELYRARPDVAAVVHAHPRAALLCGLAGLTPRPVVGSYNMPALRMARAGIPVYPRSILISRRELGEEMARAMDGSPTCLLRGHGITVTGASVEEATVAAVDLETLYAITLELARLGASPPPVPQRDLDELPDLGAWLNVRMAWDAMAAELDERSRAAAPAGPP
jgi:ribulose-5-phosphate 4-epimerase/fuculose-1-phosphate aldolase